MHEFSKNSTVISRGSAVLVHPLSIKSPENILNFYSNRLAIVRNITSISPYLSRHLDSSQPALVRLTAVRLMFQVKK